MAAGIGRIASGSQLQNGLAVSAGLPGCGQRQQRFKTGGQHAQLHPRSEERRVGKECRARRMTMHSKKKKETTLTAEQYISYRRMAVKTEQSTRERTIKSNQRR